MTLDEIKLSVEKEAQLLKVETVDENGNKVIKGYEELSKNELGNGYCDWDELSYFSKDENERTKAEIMKSRYWAAILLRYWYKIPKWILESKSLRLPATTFFDWLHDSLHDAFYYRSWRLKRRARPNDPDSEWIDNPQYNNMDSNVFDRSVNFFCGARRGKEYQAANKDRRKANVITTSIDKTVEEDGDSILDRNEGLATKGSGYNGIKALVNLFLDNNKFLEALIIDNMAYGDSYKTTKSKKSYKTTEYNLETEQNEEVEIEYNSYSYDFNERKLVKSLTEIDDNYFTEYFNKKYQVDDYKPILDSVKGVSNNKLYKEVEKTICTIRSNPELVEYLTNK